MRLQDYPRPTDDNGLGIHFGHDLRRVTLVLYVPKMLELKLKWCLIAHQDEVQLQTAAQSIWSAGIMPIVRWICPIDDSSIDLAHLVRTLGDLGIPAYIQVFNEPGNAREWASGPPDFTAFLQRWGQQASAVASAGGYPGLQVLGADELKATLHYLTSGQGSQEGVNVPAVLDRIWFCPHLYSANHPPDYPYDARNQQDHPGATALRDDVTTLGFMQFAPIFQEELGFIPPFIVGEGGWILHGSEDPRYPKISDSLHAQYYSTLFGSFRTGKLANGEPLPNYLLAFCASMLYGPDAGAWYSWTTGVRKQTILALSSAPEFVRTFNWDPTPAPAAKTLRHYVLFGPPSAHATRAMLLGARNYIAQFGPAVGFDATDAANAESVTIIGDVRVVSSSVEAQLKRAGCKVERLIGDQYAIDAVFSDRTARGTEFG